MKALWKRVVGWVVWRWTLPARYRELEELLAKQRAELLARSGRATEVLLWKARYEREAAFNVTAGKRYADLQERCKSLENGETASGLSLAEVERLALLVMAAGKMAAEAGKVVLHGWASPSPATGRPIYADVERGMGRVAAAMELMMDVGDVRGGDVRAHAGRTRARIGEQATRQ